jgi:hypothetical protein
VLLAACFLLVSSLTFASTLKMEAVFYSETSMDIYQPERRYMPEGSSIRISEGLLLCFLQGRLQV